MTSGIGNRRIFAEGFTLIEVLVATLILSAGLAAIIGAYSSAVTALNAVTDTLMTTQILREKAADLELATDGAWQNLPAGGGLCQPPYSGYEWSVMHRSVHAESGVEGTEVAIEAWRVRQRDRHALITHWAVLARRTAPDGTIGP